MKNTIPFENGQPKSCHRFEGMISLSSDTGKCDDMETFNRSSVTNCGDAPMVFRTDELSIANEVYEIKIQYITILVNLPNSWY